MSKGNRWFAGLLSRLLGTGSVGEEERTAIRRFPDRSRGRRELPLPRPGHVVTTVQQFVTAGGIDERGAGKPMPQYPTGSEGLKALGWHSWPYDVKTLGEGFFGSVQLVYWHEDLNLHLERRRFAALKVQKLLPRNVDNVWIEIAVLRGIQHENVIDYFGSFVVAPETGQIAQSTASSSRAGQAAAGAGKVTSPKLLERADREAAKRSFAGTSATSPERVSPKRPPSLTQAAAHEPMTDEVWILLEFADAGDMATEIVRYPNRVIPEKGARYYMIQICAGLRYLHEKGVVHNDLHFHNVILKYLSDGRTKKCLICDFGLAEVRSREHEENVAADVRDAAEILGHMLTGVPRAPPDHEPVLSDLTRSLFSDCLPTAKTVRRLTRHEWFRGEASAPDPLAPTEAATGREPVMDYVNPELPPPKLDAKARWVGTGRGRQAVARSPPPPVNLPAIAEEEAESVSRTRPGSGRGRTPHSDTTSHDSDQSFQGFFK